MVKETALIRNNTIDIIRGLAIIMVAFVHYGQTFGDPLITQFGAMGCQIFLFSSGYACSLSYNRLASNLKFYKKRYWSIAPGFYTALIAVVLINIMGGKILHRSIIGTGNTSPISVACNFLLIHGLLPFCNNNVFPGGWYIGTTVILYLLHPIMDIILKKRYRNINGIIIAVLLSVINIIISFLLFDTFLINGFMYFFFLNQAGCYLLGIVAYYNERESIKQTKLPIGCQNDNFFSDRYINIFLAVFFLGLSIFMFYYKCEYYGSLMTLCMGLFSYYFYFLLKRFKKLILKPLLRVGEESFYIYLTHVFAVRTFAGCMKRILEKIGIVSNPLLFLIELVPCVLMIYCLTCLLKRVIAIEQNFFKHACLRL